MIESTVPDQPLSKLSPFVIQKVLKGLVGSQKSVKKLKSGSLLVEVERAVHARTLMNIKHFFNIPAKCSPHSSLNMSKGIIRCPDLADISEEEITMELADQNVTATRRITVFRDGVRRPTNTLVLTFGTAILPKSLTVGYLKVAVDVYIPNPLQCYSCYKFGHHEKKCKLNQGELCRRCGNSNVVHKSADICDQEIKCINCKGEHIATSRSCPVCRKEKEVVTVKYTEGLPFPEARKIVEARHNLNVSYAKATSAKLIQRKDAYTQTGEIAVQTKPQEKVTNNKGTVQQKPPSASKTSHNSQKDPASTEKTIVKTNSSVALVKAPSSPSQRRNKSPNKVLSDRLPKGSDDQIQQHNRFEYLDEDMEAEDTQADQNLNRQGRIIKINNKR